MDEMTNPLMRDLRVCWRPDERAVKHAAAALAADSNPDMLAAIPMVQPGKTYGIRLQLGDRAGTVGWATIHADGRWAVFEDFARSAEEDECQSE